VTVRAAVVTTGRADYGLLHPLLALLDRDARFELRLIATGSHRVDVRGAAVDEIETDHLPVFARIELPVGGDDRLDIARATGAAVSLLADALVDADAGVVVLLGDRFETFAAATAALMLDVPIAHIHGGELTAGSVDDPLRHAITKMATLHFAAAEPYRRRIVQMGAPSGTVFDVGALAIDNVLGTTLMDPDTFGDEFGVACDSGTLLATFHPVTRGGDTAVELAALLAALDALPDLSVLFTAPNADAGGRTVGSVLEDYVRRRGPRAHLVASLGRRGYLSAARNAAAVVGNSSSGLIEVPALGVPSVDIGLRQAGRLRPPSVIHAEADEACIVAAIARAMSPEWRAAAALAPNPYGHGGAAARMADLLADRDLMRCARGARFVDLEFEEADGDC
jgi:UDP-hydrolysing UDP-N-acetyl-D-glucosamine 2-epimerase